ncbi:MAG TPA: thioredoxin family protein [Pirellulales bacterium]|jgi:thioredoxin 1|nr:thioredoxin family protein [Pirellulales bacterium]
MRLAIICLLLFLTPVAALLGYKNYQQFQAQQLAEEKAAATGAPREVLFFNASWCGPCRHMKPIVAQLKGQGYRLRDVDVDRNRALAQKYGVHGIPTFVFLQNGKEQHRFSGGTSIERLKSLCANYR